MEDLRFMSELKLRPPKRGPSTLLGMTAGRGSARADDAASGAGQRQRTSQCRAETGSMAPARWCAVRSVRLWVGEAVRAAVIYDRADVGGYEVGAFDGVAIEFDCSSTNCECAGTNALGVNAYTGIRAEVKERLVVRLGYRLNAIREGVGKRPDIIIITQKTTFNCRRADATRVIVPVTRHSPTPAMQESVPGKPVRENGKPAQLYVASALASGARPAPTSRRIRSAAQAPKILAPFAVMVTASCSITGLLENPKGPRRKSDKQR